jgi:hypothetical protein
MTRAYYRQRWGDYRSYVRLVFGGVADPVERRSLWAAANRCSASQVSEWADMLRNDQQRYWRAVRFIQTAGLHNPA